MSDNEQPTAPFWMTTFSDMMTLLMVFFVLIVSMSEVKVERFQEALTYFQGGRGVLMQQSVMQNSMQTQETPHINLQRAERFERLNEYLREKGLQDKVQVSLRPDGVHTVITDSVMFNTGEARIIEPARTILGLLAGVIDAGVEAVAVEGHTDSRPIRTMRYPTNWELSAARAAAVVRFLQQQVDVLDPKQYVALGYGEHRPVATNATPAGRASNRRVEILFSWEPWQNKMNPQLKNLPKARISNQVTDADS